MGSVDEKGFTYFFSHEGRGGQSDLLSDCVGSYDRVFFDTPQLARGPNYKDSVKLFLFNRERKVFAQKVSIYCQNKHRLVDVIAYLCIVF